MSYGQHRGPIPSGVRRQDLKARSPATPIAQREVEIVVNLKPQRTSQPIPATIMVRPIGDR